MSDSEFGAKAQIVERTRRDVEAMRKQVAAAENEHAELSEEKAKIDRLYAAKTAALNKLKESLRTMLASQKNIESRMTR